MGRVGETCRMGGRGPRLARHRKLESHVQCRPQDIGAKVQARLRDEQMAEPTWRQGCRRRGLVQRDRDVDVRSDACNRLVGATIACGARKNYARQQMRRDARRPSTVSGSMKSCAIVAPSTSNWWCRCSLTIAPLNSDQVPSAWLGNQQTPERRIHARVWWLPERPAHSKPGSDSYRCVRRMQGCCSCCVPSWAAWRTGLPLDHFLSTAIETALRTACMAGSAAIESPLFRRCPCKTATQVPLQSRLSLVHAPDRRLRAQRRQRH